MALSGLKYASFPSLLSQNESWGEGNYMKTILRVLLAALAIWMIIDKFGLYDYKPMPAAGADVMPY